jgi:hypothetical protein
MRAFNGIVRFGIGLSVLALAAFSYSSAYAQNTNAECRFDSTYRSLNPAIEVEPSECDRLVRALRRATTDYLNAICRLDEARIHAANSGKADLVNGLVFAAASEFETASRVFSELSELSVFDVKISTGKQFSGAQTILRIYAVEHELNTYQDSLRILADVAGRAASELQDLRFGPDQNTAATNNAMYGLTGSMIRPGGVYRALEAAINDPGS